MVYWPFGFHKWRVPPEWRGVRRLTGAEASTELGAREFDHLCESHEAIQAMRRKKQLGKS